MILARLAVDLQHQGAEVGKALLSESSTRMVADLPSRQGFQELRFDLCAGEAGVDGRLRH